MKMGLFFHCRKYYSYLVQIIAVYKSMYPEMPLLSSVAFLGVAVHDFQQSVFILHSTAALWLVLRGNDVFKSAVYIHFVRPGES